VFVFVFFYDLYLLIYVINNSWKISKKIKIDKIFLSHILIFIFKYYKIKISSLTKITIMRIDNCIIYKNIKSMSKYLIP
jgi:hypothetical protein